jgi:hypothetical protein
MTNYASYYLFNFTGQRCRRTLATASTTTTTTTTTTPPHLPNLNNINKPFLGKEGSERAVKEVCMILVLWRGYL